LRRRRGSVKKAGVKERTKGGLYTGGKRVEVSARQTHSLKKEATQLLKTRKKGDREKELERGATGET